MGLFDKFKKKAAPALPSLTPPFPTQPDTTLKLLFSRQLPVEELTQAISRRFGSEAVARVDQLHPEAVCLLLALLPPDGAVGCACGRVWVALLILIHGRPPLSRVAVSPTAACTLLAAAF